VNFFGPKIPKDARKEGSWTLLSAWNPHEEWMGHVQDANDVRLVKLMRFRSTSWGWPFCFSFISFPRKGGLNLLAWSADPIEFVCKKVSPPWMDCYGILVSLNSLSVWRKTWHQYQRMIWILREYPKVDNEARSKYECGWSTWLLTWRGTDASWVQNIPLPLNTRTLMSRVIVREFSTGREKVSRC
jgi:hypothetical protein